MSFITRGFSGRRSERDPRLPPGQSLVGDWPVLSAGPTPDSISNCGVRSAPALRTTSLLVLKVICRPFLRARTPSTLPSFTMRPVAVVPVSTVRFGRFIAGRR